MNFSDWQPAASVVNLRRRAQLYADIRRFFATRDVLEVETPVLSQAAVTDPFLVPMFTDYAGPGDLNGKPLFLQTSPEYPMKRLLAAGSGAIYQLAKVFRNGELGDRHNPEFTMLEWYRPGFDDARLMDEVAELVAGVLEMDPASIQRLSYRDAFLRYLDIDPFRASLAELQDLARQRLDLQFDDERRDSWLELLMSHLIEPHLTMPTFIVDYPASQAALARVALDDEGNAVARRFELYVEGLELCNGYYELTDADEQRRRFEADSACRRQRQLPDHPADQRLLAALGAGMPDCAGVALGVDRLLMLACRSERLEQVLAFPLPRA